MQMVFQQKEIIQIIDFLLHKSLFFLYRGALYESVTFKLKLR